MTKIPEFCEGFPREFFTHLLKAKKFSRFFNFCHKKKTEKYTHIPFVSSPKKNYVVLIPNEFFADLVKLKMMVVLLRLLLQHQQSVFLHVYLILHEMEDLEQQYVVKYDRQEHLWYHGCVNRVMEECPKTKKDFRREKFTRQKIDLRRLFLNWTCFFLFLFITSN